MVSLKWIEFFGETDPIEYFSEAQQSMFDSIDLHEPGFSFALDSIEEQYGSLKATQVNWSGQNGVKYETEIDLVKCDSIGHLKLANSFTEARRGKNEFLCPETKDNL